MWIFNPAPPLTVKNKETSSTESEPLSLKPLINRKYYLSISQYYLLIIDTVSTINPARGEETSE